jgi:hypothetical protein
VPIPRVLFLKIIPQDLVAHSEDQYVSIAVRLLSDPSALEAMMARVAAADLSTLQDAAEADIYPSVFRALIDAEQHSELLSYTWTASDFQECAAQVKERTGNAVALCFLKVARGWSE